MTNYNATVTWAGGGALSAVTALSVPAMASLSGAGALFAIGAVGTNGGTPADSATPTSTHTYTAPGTYQVLLTVTDNNGSSATTSQSVTVTTPASNTPPVALFTLNNPNNASVVSTNGSTSYDPDPTGSIAAYDWNWGDGSTHTSGPTSSHTYTSLGTYSITLTVTDNQGATATQKQTVTVSSVNAAPGDSFVYGTTRPTGTNTGVGLAAFGYAVPTSVYTGTLSFATDTTIINKIINGPLEPQSNVKVTLINCIIQGNSNGYHRLLYVYNPGAHIVAQFCDIRGNGTQKIAAEEEFGIGVGADGGTAANPSISTDRCHIYNLADGFDPNAGVIQDRGSCVERFTTVYHQGNTDNRTHNHGIAFSGGAGHSFFGTSIVAMSDLTTSMSSTDAVNFNAPSYQYAAAAIAISQGSTATNIGFTIDSCWLDGGLDIINASRWQQANAGTIKNTRIGRQSYNAASYFVSPGASLLTNFNWINNVWMDTGGAVPAPLGSVQNPGTTTPPPTPPSGPTASGLNGKAVISAGPPTASASFTFSQGVVSATGSASTTLAPSPAQYFMDQAVSKQVTTLHPTQGNVMQCVVYVPQTGYYYQSQAHNGSNGQTTPYQTTTIARFSGGVEQERFTLVDAAHPTSIAAEYNADSYTYFWASWQKAASGGKQFDIVRIKYHPGDGGNNYTRDSMPPDTTVPYKGGLDNGLGKTDVQFDTINDRAVVRFERTGVYRLYSYTTFLAGSASTSNVLHTLTPNLGSKVLQGYATFGNSLFIYTGVADGLLGVNAADPPMITEYSWTTGAVLSTYNASAFGKVNGVWPGSPAHYEPEGLSVFANGSTGMLLAGMCTGNHTSDTDTYNFLEYSITLPTTNKIVSWSWNWGDGSSATSGATATHTYSANGAYTVVLTVTDSAGRTATYSQPIYIVLASSTPAPVTPGTGGFTPGTVQPNATNVGAGVIRPMPTGSRGTLSGNQTISGTTILSGMTINGNVIMSGNSQLVDCIVNGVVTCTGGTPYIENNVIQGDGVSTSSPYFYIVNTSAATLATVRFNDIKWRTSSYQINGVGVRNMLLEYNDISQVVDCIDIDGVTLGSNGVDANTKIRCNYLHDLLFFAPATNSGHKPSGDGTPPKVDGTSLLYNGLWTETLTSAQASAAGLSTGAGTYYVPLNHGDIIQITGNAKNVLFQGNNSIARWSTNYASGTLPTYTAPDGTKTVTYIELSCLMANAVTGLQYWDNWVDAGEVSLNLASTVAGQGGDFRRNKFGRAMAPYGLSSTAPTTMVSNGGATWYFHVGTSDQNVFADNGAPITIRGPVS